MSTEVWHQVVGCPTEHSAGHPSPHESAPSGPPAGSNMHFRPIAAAGSTMQRRGSVAMGADTHGLSSFDLAGLVSTADSPRLGTPATVNLRAGRVLHPTTSCHTSMSTEVWHQLVGCSTEVLCAGPAAPAGGPLAPAPPGRGGTGQVLHEHHHHHHHEHDGVAWTSMHRVHSWPTWAIAGREARAVGGGR